jgi:hypothetical protein
VYFLANQTDHAVSYAASFRVAGKRPELWHAETDVVEAAPVWREEKGRVVVPLEFAPSQSVFVVFKDLPGTDVNPLVEVKLEGNPYVADLRASEVTGAVTLKATAAGEYRFTWRDGKSKTVKVENLPAAMDLSTDWEVAFQPLRGAPEKVALEKLISWTEHADAGVKYFSGTGTYTKEIDVPAEMKGANRRVFLDLGVVKNVAEVKVNGKDLPLMWLPPFRADVTEFVRAGKNSLQVAVTNLWVNRLIGDEQEPDDLQWSELKSMPIKPPVEVGRFLTAVPEWINDPASRPSKGRVTFTTFKFFKKDSPLLPSGLIGPVRLEAGEMVEVRP